MAWFCQLHAAAEMDATAQAAITVRDSPRVSDPDGLESSVKVSQLAEQHEAVVDFLACELLQALGAKTLHGE